MKCPIKNGILKDIQKEEIIRCGIWALDDWEKNIDLESKKYADNNLVCFRIYIY